jgi:hypothetical protein
MQNGYNGLIPEIPGTSQAGQDAAVNNAGGGSFSWLTGNQQTVEGLDGVKTTTGNPGVFGKGGLAQTGIAAISTLGSLWNSFQQNKIAKKSLALQERTFETNLGNQTKTYNTELEDRIRTRYASEGRDSSEADAYVEKNKL